MRKSSEYIPESPTHSPDSPVAPNAPTSPPFRPNTPTARSPSPPPHTPSPKSKARSERREVKTNHARFSSSAILPAVPVPHQRQTSLWRGKQQQQYQQPIATHAWRLAHNALLLRDQPLRVDCVEDSEFFFAFIKQLTRPEHVLRLSYEPPHIASIVFERLHEVVDRLLVVRGDARAAAEGKEEEDTEMATESDEDKKREETSLLQSLLRLLVHQRTHTAQSLKNVMMSEQGSSSSSSSSPTVCLSLAHALKTPVQSIRLPSPLVVYTSPTARQQMVSALIAESSLDRLQFYPFVLLSLSALQASARELVLRASSESPQHSNDLVQLLMEASRSRIHRLFDSFLQVRLPWHSSSRGTRFRACEKRFKELETAVARLSDQWQGVLDCTAIESKNGPSDDAVRSLSSMSLMLTLIQVASHSIASAPISPDQRDGFLAIVVQTVLSQTREHSPIPRLFWDHPALDPGGEINKAFRSIVLDMSSLFHSLTFKDHDNHDQLAKFVATASSISGLLSANSSSKQGRAPDLLAGLDACFQKVAYTTVPLIKVDAEGCFACTSDELEKWLVQHLYLHEVPRAREYVDTAWQRQIPLTCVRLKSINATSVLVNLQNLFGLNGAFLSSANRPQPSAEQKWNKVDSFVTWYDVFVVQGFNGSDLAAEDEVLLLLPSVLWSALLECLFILCTDPADSDQQAIRVRIDAQATDFVRMPCAALVDDMMRSSSRFVRRAAARVLERWLPGLRASDSMTVQGMFRNPFSEHETRAHQLLSTLSKCVLSDTDNLEESGLVCTLQSFATLIDELIGKLSANSAAATLSESEVLVKEITSLVAKVRGDWTRAAGVLDVKAQVDNFTSREDQLEALASRQAQTLELSQSVTECFQQNLSVHCELDFADSSDSDHCSSVRLKKPAESLAPVAMSVEDKKKSELQTPAAFLDSTASGCRSLVPFRDCLSLFIRAAELSRFHSGWGNTVAALKFVHRQRSVVALEKERMKLPHLCAASYSLASLSVKTSQWFTVTPHRPGVLFMESFYANPLANSLVMQPRSLDLVIRSCWPAFCHYSDNIVRDLGSRDRFDLVKKAADFARNVQTTLFKKLDNARRKAEQSRVEKAKPQAAVPRPLDDGEDLFGGGSAEDMPLISDSSSSRESKEEKKAEYTPTLINSLPDHIVQPFPNYSPSLAVPEPSSSSSSASSSTASTAPEPVDESMFSDWDSFREDGEDDIASAVYASSNIGQLLEQQMDAEKLRQQQLMIAEIKQKQQRQREDSEQQKKKKTDSPDKQVSRKRGRQASSKGSSSSSHDSGTGNNNNQNGSTSDSNPSFSSSSSSSALASPAKRHRVQQAEEIEAPFEAAEKDAEMIASVNRPLPMSPAKAASSAPRLPRADPASEDVVMAADDTEHKKDAAAPAAEKEEEGENSIFDEIKIEEDENADQLMTDISKADAVKPPAEPVMNGHKEASKADLTACWKALSHEFTHGKSRSHATLSMFDSSKRTFDAKSIMDVAGRRLRKAAWFRIEMKLLERPKDWKHAGKAVWIKDDTNPYKRRQKNEPTFIILLSLKTSWIKAVEEHCERIKKCEPITEDSDFYVLTPEVIADIANDYRALTSSK